jgi:hypothetical protein
MQSQRCAAEVELPGHSYQIAQVPQLHAHKHMSRVASIEGGLSQYHAQ